MSEQGLKQRRFGVLLPVTALPDSPGNGDFDQAYRFIDWLSEVSAGIWQMLPMGIPHDDRSPYLALSAQAGNPLLIGLSWLQKQELLAPDIDISVPPDKISAVGFRRSLLESAYRAFLRKAPAQWYGEYQAFREQNRYWLEDHALFVALREEQDYRPWFEWDEPLRDRQGYAIKAARARLAENIDSHQFVQFLFFKQWAEIRDHAERAEILLFGDMPLFVAHDSADVWANRHYFQLDGRGQCRVVSGVPPDYFSTTGQRWGNPHYRWHCMEDDNFHWWVERFRTALNLYDWIRIDHFRGLQAVWEIPADSGSAEEGKWRETPGEALLKALQRTLGSLPLVAEDLGFITPEVTGLRNQFALPGMAVLQFAFDGGADNPYLPHNLEKNCVLYTGTHDNDTTAGWFAALKPARQQHIARYLQCDINRIPEMLVSTAMASVARWAIIPLQDLLGLDSSHRINTPGTVQGNWQWRFHWEQIPPELAGVLREKNHLYGRD